MFGLGEGSGTFKVGWGKAGETGSGGGDVSPFIRKRILQTDWDL